MIHRGRTSNSILATTSDHARAHMTRAALDKRPVSGWTHNFYRYPARFSPQFAAAVVELFSRPGDLILDPYMGGGTAVVEGIVAGRRVVGNDLNALAVFVAKVKTTPLLEPEVHAIRQWIALDVPTFSYRVPSVELAAFMDPVKTHNLSLIRARFIKKAAAAGLASLGHLPSQNARAFARCALLRVSQWALDGRKTHTSLSAFRQRLAETTAGMLASIESLGEHLKRSGARATITNVDAEALAELPIFANERATLIVTSPPYPGVHVLYHRWQVDGRRETPAPYWITGCADGRGASFYNFGDRRQSAADAYFRTSLNTLHGIRRVIREGAHTVQLLAFNKPDEQLPRYLENMASAGFAEVSPFGKQRIWREVPNRKWHANLRGRTSSAREVVLVHRAL